MLLVVVRKKSSMPARLGTERQLMELPADGLARYLIKCLAQRRCEIWTSRHDDVHETLKTSEAGVFPWTSKLWTMFPRRKHLTRLASPHPSVKIVSQLRHPGVLVWHNVWPLCSQYPPICGAATVGGSRYAR